MSECLACWLLAGKLGLPVDAEAPGRKAKMLDMGTVIDGQEVGVEVKAPREKDPRDDSVGVDSDDLEDCYSGNESDLLEQCLESANKKFADNIANVLVIVPRFRSGVFDDRNQLVTALYGQERITFSIDPEAGTAGQESTKFFPDGRLLRRRLPTGQWVKPDRKPAFTRVSAVIVVEERMMCKWARDPHSHRVTEAWIDHDLLVAHNPHALYPISPASFRGYIQFMDLGRGYGWSDGESL